MQIKSTESIKVLLIWYRKLQCINKTIILRISEKFTLHATQMQIFSLIQNSNILIWRSYDDFNLSVVYVPTKLCALITANLDSTANRAQEDQQMIIKSE